MLLYAIVFCYDSFIIEKKTDTATALLIFWSREVINDVEYVY